MNEEKEKKEKKKRKERKKEEEKKEIRMEGKGRPTEGTWKMNVV